MSFLPVSHTNEGDASVFRSNWAGTDASAVGTSVTQTAEFAAVKNRISQLVARFDAIDPADSSLLTADEIDTAPQTRLVRPAGASRTYQDASGWFFLCEDMGDADTGGLPVHRRLYWFDDLGIARKYRSVWAASCAGIRTYHDDDEYREAEFLGPESAFTELRRFCETAAEPCEILVSDIVDSSQAWSGGKWPSFYVPISKVNMLKRDDLSHTVDGSVSHNTMEGNRGRGWWQMSLIRNCWCGLIDDYDTGISEVWISTADECPPGMTPWFCNETADGGILPVKRKLVGRYASFYDWDSEGPDPDTMLSYAAQRTDASANFTHRNRRICPADGSLYTEAEALAYGKLTGGDFHEVFKTWDSSGACHRVMHDHPALCCAGAIPWSKQWNFNSYYSWFASPEFSCNLSLWEYTVLSGLFSAYYGTVRHWEVSQMSNAHSYSDSDKNSSHEWISMDSPKYYDSSETLTEMSSDWLKMMPAGVTDPVAGIPAVSRADGRILKGDEAPGIGVMSLYMSTRDSGATPIVNRPGIFMYIENPTCPQYRLTGAKMWKKEFQTGTFDGRVLPDSAGYGTGKEWQAPVTMAVSSNRSNATGKWYNNSSWGFSAWLGFKSSPIKESDPLYPYQTDTSLLNDYVINRDDPRFDDPVSIRNIYVTKCAVHEGIGYGAAVSFNATRMPVHIKAVKRESGSNSGAPQARTQAAHYTYGPDYDQSYRETLWDPLTSSLINNYRAYQNSVASVTFMYRTSSNVSRGPVPVVDVQELPDGYERLTYAGVAAAAYSSAFNDVTFSAHNVVVSAKIKWDLPTNNRFLIESKTGWDKAGNNAFRWVFYQYSSNNGVRTDINNSSGVGDYLMVYSPRTDVTHVMKVSVYDNSISVYHDGALAGTKSVTMSQNNKEYCLFGITSNYYFSGQVYWLSIARNDGTVLYDFVPARRKSDGAVGLYDLANDMFRYDSGHPLYAP